MILDVDRLDGGHESIPLNEQHVVASRNEFDTCSGLHYVPAGVDALTRQQALRRVLVPFWTPRVRVHTFAAKALVREF